MAGQTAGLAIEFSLDRLNDVPDHLHRFAEYGDDWFGGKFGSLAKAYLSGHFQLALVFKFAGQAHRPGYGYAIMQVAESSQNEGGPRQGCIANGDVSHALDDPLRVAGGDYFDVSVVVRETTESPQKVVPSRVRFQLHDLLGEAIAKEGRQGGRAALDAGEKHLVETRLILAEGELDPLKVGNRAPMLPCSDNCEMLEAGSEVVKRITSPTAEDVGNWLGHAHLDRFPIAIHIFENFWDAAIEKCVGSSFELLDIFFRPTEFGMRPAKV